MVWSCIGMLQIPFELFKFAFECFESFRMLWICNRMLRIPFERIEFAFKCFECHSKGTQICIQMLSVWFEWLQFAFECFKSLWSSKLYSNSLNLFSSGSNLRLNSFGMDRICIRMFRIPFKLLELAFESFESNSKGTNLQSNAFSLVRMVTICIQMLQILFESFKLTFECCESLLNISNMHSNGANLLNG